MLPGTARAPKQTPALNIDLSRLPGDMRRPIWNWMLEHRPAVCEWLGGDQCKMMRESFSDFGCAPVLDLSREEADELMARIPGLSRYAI